MNYRALKLALTISVLLNIFLIHSVITQKTVIAPTETEDTAEQTADETVEKTVYESGQTYPLMRIVDGDTIIVGFEGTTEYVRLIGIDSPELNDPGGTQCYAEEAMTHLQEIAQTGLVVLFFDESQGMRDSYGRLLAYVEMPDGVDLGEQMLADGFAREYTYAADYSRKEAYRLAEQEATAEGRGLWQEDACSN